jgi:putative drug exporter of the RND superfamily
VNDGQHTTQRPGRLARLADLAFRRRRLVLLAWIVGLAAAFAASGALAGEFSADYATPGSESQRAGDLLAQRFPARSSDTVDVVWEAKGGVDSAAVQKRTAALLTAATHLKGIGAAAPPEISRDGTIAVSRLSLTARPDSVPVTTGKSLISLSQAASQDGLRVEMGGQVITNAQESALSSEAVGLMIAALVLVLTFGTLVAAGLPIVTALFGLGISSAAVGLLAAVMDVPDWSTAVASMIGLGVGIDYALLILTRHRAALATGLEPQAAVVEAVTTAGRSVLVAGTTVVISLLGLFLMGLSYLQGVALSASFAVLVTMAASVTLLPALLGFAGRNIERLHVPFVNKDPHAYDTSRWYRWSRFIQRRPWVAAMGGLAVLLALAAPFLGIRFGSPDAQNDPPSYTTHRAYDLLADGFGPGFSAPMLLTVQGGPDGGLPAAADAVGDRLREVDGVAFVGPAVVNETGDTALLRLVASTSPQDAATEDLVDTLRDEAVPAATAGTDLSVEIGGMAAANLDSTRGVVDRLPLFFGGVLLVSFLLLMLVFRSVVVPLKAVVMNLLASAAAFGVLTLAVSGGPLGDLVGIPEATPVPILIPIGVFAILFGLSMDYEVFLLSRIKEEYDRTGDNALAVADGLAKSARVITAGAAVMITVFLSFVLGQDVLAKMFGIGLASAVLIDATLVRMVLVPATMELLGDRNWWLPAWLDRLLPHVRVEGRELPDAEAALPEAVRIG